MERGWSSSSSSAFLALWEPREGGGGGGGGTLFLSVVSIEETEALPTYWLSSASVLLCFTRTGEEPSGVQVKSALTCTGESAFTCTGESCPKISGTAGGSRSSVI